jgi:hypothetical protein
MTLPSKAKMTTLTRSKTGHFTIWKGREFPDTIAIKFLGCPDAFLISKGVTATFSISRSGNYVMVDPVKDSGDLTEEVQKQMARMAGYFGETAELNSLAPNGGYGVEHDGVSLCVYRHESFVVESLNGKKLKGTNRMFDRFSIGFDTDVKKFHDEIGVVVTEVKVPSDKKG